MAGYGVTFGDGGPVSGRKITGLPAALMAGDRMKTCLPALAMARRAAAGA
ncbi:hypothetical protein Q0Z83_007120 [Actinoplanes sichuanensis]|nr:hypothetical protein Q0Z83_007120 [Actinoplanes sichuanensis]